MKVRPYKNLSQGFSVNYVYEVYSILYQDGELLYILIGDSGRRTWIDPNLFEVVDGTIPPNWKFGFLPNERFVIAMWGYDEWFSEPDYTEELYELTDAGLNPLIREKELNTPPIDQFDIVQARTDVPYAFIPNGTYGTVTGRPDTDKDKMEVTFHKEDGTDYPPVTVPRLFLKLDTKT